MVLCILLFFLVKEILLKAPGKSIKKLEMKKFMAMIGQKFEVFTIFLRKYDHAFSMLWCGVVSILVDIMIFYSMEDN